MRKLSTKKTMGLDDITCGAGKAGKGNFYATTLNLAEIYDHPLVHISIYSYIFAQGHGFEALTVTSGKYFVSLH